MILSLQETLQILQSGDVVAIPTETVYGLAADANNPSAIRKVFALKNRPADHPVIVHLSPNMSLADWAINIPEAAHRLTAVFWPGPLTLVLPKAPHVSSLVTGGQDTIALRSPRHPLTQQLLEVFGTGVIAPSANPFGQLSPTTAEHVLRGFSDQVPVLDGGGCEIGIESTIVHVTRDAVTLLRPGDITIETIAAVANLPVNTKDSTIRAPGKLSRHYAPRTPLFLCEAGDVEMFVQSEPNRKTAVLSMEAILFSHPSVGLSLLPADPRAYARDLYATLHTADNSGYDRILLVAPPRIAAWSGVWNRIERAASWLEKDAS